MASDRVMLMIAALEAQYGAVWKIQHVDYDWVESMRDHNGHHLPAAGRATMPN